MGLPTVIDLAEALIRSASIIQEKFGTPLTHNRKEDDTLVCAIDHAINSALMEWAHSRGLGFFGEEANGDSNNECILYVDPLDGTGAFLRGMATATSIASIMHVEGGFGIPIMSVIYNPVTTELWLAEHDRGTSYRRGDNPLRKVRVEKNPTDRWRSALCAWPGVPKVYSAVVDIIRTDRRFDDQQMGAFGIGGGLIASGLLHATAISETSAVETAAMSLIVKEAGGLTTDLSGTPIERFRMGEWKGKQDFLLPNGAIIACSKEVVDLIATLHG